MKAKYIFTIALTACALLLFNTTACSDSSDNGIPEEIIPGTDDGENNTEISEASIELVTKSWGDYIEAVKSEQRKGLKLLNEDSEFLKYANKSESFAISYDFVNSRLRAALLLVPVNSVNDAGRYKLTGYEYLGNIDGAAVYMSPDGITLGTVINRNIDGRNYIAIGFAPIESDLFDMIAPIVVTTLTPKNVGKNSMTLCGSYTGTAESPKASIRYSFDKDMSKSWEYTCAISNGAFERTVTGIATNSTVYYKAIVNDEGIKYEGDVESADVEYQVIYNIGDPYPNATSPEGVVCSVRNGGANGTIISLDEDYLKWDLNGIFCTRYYCRSTSDGSLNNMGNTNPYAKWVNGHGAGWYGPARGQLVISKENLAKINRGLRAVNGTVFEGFYWSSSEYDANIAWITTVTETSYMGYSNGHYFYNNKDNSRNVRAMKNF